jgi:hypothetical protein
MIPDKGVRMPMRIKEEGDMWRVVFPKRIAVDVIVVKPTRIQQHPMFIRDIETCERKAHHLREETRRRDNEMYFEAS